MSEITTVLGEEPEHCSRDAIHVAVVPCYSDRVVFPSQGLFVVARQSENGLWFTRLAFREPATGIVDPFLDSAVQPGCSFWLCLYPGTVTSLRHRYSHPGVPEYNVPKIKPEVEEEEDRDLSIAWMRLFVNEVVDNGYLAGYTKRFTYEDAIKAGYDYQSTGDDMVFADDLNDDAPFEDYWKHWCVITGVPYTDSLKAEDAPFSCAC